MLNVTNKVEWPFGAFLSFDSFLNFRGDDYDATKEIGHIKVRQLWKKSK